MPPVDQSHQKRDCPMGYPWKINVADADFLHRHRKFPNFSGTAAASALAVHLADQHEQQSDPEAG